MQIARWWQPVWEGEGTGGAAPTETKSATEVASPGEGGGGQPVDKTVPVSLRSQMAQSFEGDDRESFNAWSGRYNTDKEFFGSVMSMRRQFDARVPVPGADAKPEERAKYFQRVGAPKEAKDYNYTFKDAEGKPRRLNDEETARLEGYREFAYKHHYTQEQFEAGIDYLEADNARQVKTFDQQISSARQRSVDQLREEWGADFENNVNHAVEGGILYAGSADAWASFTDLPLANGMRVGDHPTLIKTMAKVGRLSSEDQRVREMHTSGEAESVKAEIARLEQEAQDKRMSTSQEPYHSKLEVLYKKLYPKKHVGGHGAVNGFGGN